MKSKSKTLLSAMLALALLAGMFAAAPLVAHAEDEPFQVTENPVGAIYVLNQTAVPIKAIFRYDALAELGTIDSATYIKVQWYWSSENSNTGRTNGQGEHEVQYSRRIEHQTTLTPTTNTAGVRYYYAVISYGKSVATALGQWEVVPAETVTAPARIEVIAPGTTEPEPEPEQSFVVKKVDGDGKPLAGAVFSLVPDTEHAWGEKKSYEATSKADGTATFTVAEGAYILSEKQAPAGYNATDESYIIWVQDDAVQEVIDYKTQKFEPYEPVTFINKEIPSLNKDDHFAFIQGYPEGTVMPERNMTRAEAVIMFSRLLTKSMNETANYRNNYYPDVPAKDWYANQVGYMQQLGVLADYARDGRFRPNEPVTRAEFATLAAHFDNLTLTSTNNFSDVPAGHWAVKYINSAAAKGWIIGNPDGTFKPEANITRAEVVTLVGRMLNRTADSAYLAANASSLPRTYSDLKTTHWAYLALMEASIGHDYIMDSGSEHWTAVYE